MAHDKKCLNCGKLITGNINKLFCNDSCRKYYKRHGNVSFAGVSTVSLPDLSGQSRTTPRATGSSVGNYASKKGIDLLAKLVENTFMPSKLPVASPPIQRPTSPLHVFSAEALMNDPVTEWLREEVALTPPFQALLGKITFPFKMLVWGLPGSGKSTFCMQLANQIATKLPLLYIAGEEGLSSQTLLDKQKRTITSQNAKNFGFIDRLPTTQIEWNQVLHLTDSIFAPLCKAIFYDSVTKLGITPFYVDAAANDYHLPVLATAVSHIFITHAHKDGNQYRGDGSWGHEVDVIVRVEKGVATTEKNRFGEEGQSIKVY